eukprot:TRINITY_DN63681_c0_g1_i1.p1 TRINITY_DN63681_c0_g1~~TRINITY_DN63681_c0_g1_i1.p1  ORF type:complete len:624 (-),score=115.62 TRINITY_DN63681_c0_g1_i1:208-1803(-)
MHDPHEPWTRSRLLQVQNSSKATAKASATGTARQTASREVQLQLRIATEEDRKDPGHSGHTDSIYYAGVKEQQALQKQAQEARQLKKRQRRMRVHPVAATVGSTASKNVSPADDAVMSARHESISAPADGAVASSSSTSAAVASGGAGAALPARLGFRGLMDPLLFLRAPGPAESGHGEGSAAPTGECTEDLKSALRRAEAEYAALPLPGAPISARGRGQGRGRGRSQHSAGGVESSELQSIRRERSASSKDAATGALPRRQQPEGMQQRGKKRRPVEQEPRPVSNAAPPQRRVRAHPAVEGFLAQHRLRCQRVSVLRTFRGITFKMQAKKKAAKAQQSAPAVVPPTEEETAMEGKPPWEQYLRLNSHFTRHGHFMHTVAWEVEGRRVLTVVPHPTRVDLEVLAKALQKPKESIRQRKLKDISVETGFPVFVCPPVGHPVDGEGRAPLLLVDGAVTEYTRPLLFDCGAVGLSMPASELLRATGASCIDGLGMRVADGKSSLPDELALKEAAPLTLSDGFGCAATPEPAPEP